MIYLSEIRDFLKRFNVFDNYYVGKIDNKQDKSLGVYQRKTSNSPVKSFGNNSTYGIKNISLLIHWNKNAVETEKAAFQLYQSLETAQEIQINGKNIYALTLLQSEPIDVGTDEKGVYERVIEFDLYYERRK